MRQYTSRTNKEKDTLEKSISFNYKLVLISTPPHKESGAICENKSNISVRINSVIHPRSISVYYKTRNWGIVSNVTDN